MLVTFSTCPDFIRTVPALQHDKDRIEDVDTDGEDHAGDEGRYACMSRPWVPTTDAQQSPVFAVDSGQMNVTLDELWAETPTREDRY